MITLSAQRLKALTRCHIQSACCFSAMCVCIYPLVTVKYTHCTWKFACQRDGKDVPAGIRLRITHTDFKYTLTPCVCLPGTHTMRTRTHTHTRTCRHGLVGLSGKKPFSETVHEVSGLRRMEKWWASNHKLINTAGNSCIDFWSLFGWNHLNSDLFHRAWSRRNISSLSYWAV